VSGLLELAAAGRDVIVRGKPVTVTGISARGLAGLLRRFPELLELLDGKGLNMEALATLGPDVLAAIVAAGTGSAGDKRAEEIADSLGLSDQLALIEAIAVETFAGDPQGFLKRLESLAAGAGVQIGSDAAS
jgi:hypothetical protein